MKKFVSIFVCIVLVFGVCVAVNAAIPSVQPLDTVTDDGEDDWDFEELEDLPLLVERIIDANGDSSLILAHIDSLPMEDSKCNVTIPKSLKSKQRDFLSKPGKDMIEKYYRLDEPMDGNYVFLIGGETDQKITCFLSPNVEMVQPINLSQSVFQLEDNLIVLFNKCGSDSLFPVITGALGLEKLKEMYSLKLEIIQFDKNENVISSKKASFPMLTWQHTKFYPEINHETSYLYIKVEYPEVSLNLTQEYQIDLDEIQGLVEQNMFIDI